MNSEGSGELPPLISKLETDESIITLQHLKQHRNHSWAFILENYPYYANWIQGSFARQYLKHFPDNLELDFSARKDVLASILTMYKHFGPLEFIRLDLPKSFTDSGELSSIYMEGRVLGKSLIGEKPGLILCHRSSAPTGSGSYHIHALLPHLRSVPVWLKQAVKVGRAHVSLARQPNPDDLGEMVRAYQGLARYAIEPVDPRARTQRRYTVEGPWRDVTPDLLAKLEATELYLKRKTLERSRTGKNLAASRLWLNTRGQEFQSLKSDLAKELESLT